MDCERVRDKVDDFVGKNEFGVRWERNNYSCVSLQFIVNRKCKNFHSFARSKETNLETPSVSKANRRKDKWRVDY